MATTFFLQVALAPVLVQAIAASAIAQSAPPRKTVDQLVDEMLKGATSKSPPPSAAPAINLEAVRNRIGPCWLPAGVDEPMVVTLIVRMNRDATPSSVQVKDAERYRSDADFRTVADRAMRAIRDRRCQPWPLPADKYEAWRTITFNFDSRDY